MWLLITVRRVTCSRIYYHHWRFLYFLRHLLLDFLLRHKVPSLHHKLLSLTLPNRHSLDKRMFPAHLCCALPHNSWVFTADAFIFTCSIIIVRKSNMEEVTVSFLLHPAGCYLGHGLENHTNLKRKNINAHFDYKKGSGHRPAFVWCRWTYLDQIPPPNYNPSTHTSKHIFGTILAFSVFVN